MDTEQYEYDKPNPVWDWLERHILGSKLAAAADRLRERYHKHREQYHQYQEGFPWYQAWTWLVILALVLVFTATLAGLGALGWLGFRHYQETSALSAAGAMLAAGDYDGASSKIQKLLQAHPTDVPACRLMAQIADHAHSPRTLDWLQRLAQEEPTPENKLMLASTALDYEAEPYPTTTGILKDLAPLAAQSAAYQAVAATLALHAYRLSEAEAHFQLAATLEPANEFFQPALSAIEMPHTTAAAQAQFRPLLDRLRADRNLDLWVLRALVADRLSSRDLPGADSYASQLAAEPQATLGDRLVNLGILQQLHRDTFTVRLEALKTQEATNPASVVHLAYWMQTNALLAESLDWLKALPAAMLARPSVQMAMAQGYLQSAQWPALRELIASADWGDQNYFRCALLSRVWSQMDLPAAGMADHWALALRNAANRRDAMMRLLDLANTWRLGPQRQELLLQFVKQFPAEGWAAKELEQIYSEQGDTAGLYQLYSMQQEQFPDDISHKIEMTGVALLMNISTRQACQSAEDNYKAAPDNPKAAVAYAYALHLQNMDKQGIAVLKQCKAVALQQPRMALYYGVLLSAAGKNEEAGPWLQRAQTAQDLLPEEKRLLTSALAQPESPANKNSKP